MKKLTSIMAAAATSLALTGSAMAQDDETNNTTEFGPTTATFTTLGFDDEGELRLRGYWTAVYGGMEECLREAQNHHDFFTNNDLFAMFDSATRIVCDAKEYGVSITDHYGSPLAINRLHQQLGR